MAFDYASCHGVRLVPNFNQLQIQWMIWASTLQIRKHEYFGDLNFIILFVGILSLYAINWVLWVCLQIHPLRF